MLGRSELKIQMDRNKLGGWENDKHWMVHQTFEDSVEVGENEGVQLLVLFRKN